MVLLQVREILTSIVRISDGISAVYIYIAVVKALIICCFPWGQTEEAAAASAGSAARAFASETCSVFKPAEQNPESPIPLN